jgi:hypothetical protein
VHAKPDKECVTVCAVDRRNAVGKIGKIYLKVERRLRGRTEEVKWRVGISSPYIVKWKITIYISLKFPEKNTPKLHLSYVEKTRGCVGSGY